MKMVGSYPRGKPILNVGLTLVLSLCSCSNSATDQNEARLSSEGVSLLLTVVDTLLAHNPDWEVQIRNLDEPSRDSLIEALAARNRQDPAVTAAIDALVNSPTYQLYYSQFRNVTPEIHRNILLHLPYAAINSPGSIAENLQLLCFRRDEVKQWAKTVIPKVELERCRSLAAQWLPAGEYELPDIYFFCDGNGDAFARQGKIGFDLYGAVFTHLSPGLDNLDSIGADVMEPILGHELHHIFAAQFAPRATRSNDYQGVLSDVQRRIVSEGIAKQIDGLRPSQKEVFEDSQVVRNWIAQLNDRLATVKVDSTQTATFREWMGRSYHELAMEQLSSHLHSVLDVVDLDLAVRQRAVDRPSMVYTLGWWMIRTISRNGDDKQAAIALLSAPNQLFETYNAAIGTADPSLRIAL